MSRPVFNREFPGIALRRHLSRARPPVRSGQGLLEYVLLVALASIGLILVLVLFRNRIGNSMDDSSGTVQSATGSYYLPGAGASGSAGNSGNGGGNGAGGGNGGGQGSGSGRGGGSAGGQGSGRSGS